MPLYEYSCDKCSQKIELLIRGDEKPECPHCHSKKLTKLLSVVRGHVSGGGGGQATAAEMCGRPQCGMGGCQGLG
jgi:putative FmdB family regulatory protein